MYTFYLNSFCFSQLSRVKRQEAKYMKQDKIEITGQQTNNKNERERERNRWADGQKTSIFFYKKSFLTAKTTTIICYTMCISF